MRFRTLPIRSPSEVTFLWPPAPEIHLDRILQGLAVNLSAFLMTWVENSPTTTFTASIFGIFSNLRLRFLVSTCRQRIHGAVFLPDSDFAFYGTVSATVLVILRRSRFLQFVFPLILATWDYSVETYLGVPGPC